MGTYRRVLAIDQNTITGVAGTDDLCQATRWSTLVEFKQRERVDRFLAFGKWLTDRLKSTDPDLLVYEAPVVFGDAATMVKTLRLTFGFVAIIEVVATKCGIPYVDVNNVNVKSHALGTGATRKALISRAEAELQGKSPSRIKQLRMKRAMVIAARDHGWTCRTDDEADALWTLDYVCHLIRGGALN